MGSKTAGSANQKISTANYHIVNDKFSKGTKRQ